MIIQWIKNLFKKQTCDHEWEYMLHPVTLVRTSRVCYKCDTHQRTAGTIWKSSHL